jgi:putative membrane protein
VLRRVVIGTIGNAIALWAAARIVGNVDLSHSWWTVILAALLLTLLHVYVKPVLRVLAFPFVIVTLGIALFFISMLMLWLTSVLVSGFNIDGFWPLVKATIIVWLVNLVFAAIFDADDGPDRRRRPQRDRGEAGGHRPPPR